MEDNSILYRRHAEGRVLAALSDTRVVVINGARQTGKSTLARLVVAAHAGTEMRYLDDALTRAAAQSDPTAFVRHNGLLVIDEVQRVPDLILAIKHEVDLDTRPGRFLLTGSARLFAMEAVPDLLPGRTETVELWPLSQGEIIGSRDTFVDTLFEVGANMDPPVSNLRRTDYVELALRGGYPQAVARDDPGRRARFFESYVSDLIRRDVAQVSDIERPSDMRRLLALLAAQMATPLVMSGVSSRLQLPASTVKRYIDLLELLFVIRRIPAWSTNLTTRATATPKVLITDPGLAGHLVGLSTKRLTHPSAPVGPLIENFVLSEVARQLSWTDESVTLHHYRDRDDHEVDAILEHASGDVVAIEVKAAETVRQDDFRGIDHLRRRLGDRLVAGIVFHAGPRKATFGSGIVALPISTLWTT